MDKQVIIDELTRVFIYENKLNKLLENSSQDNLLEMYQALFKLWNKTLTASVVYQKQTLILTFSQAVFADIIDNRQSLDKRIIEITTLLSLSNDEKEFKTMFKKKFKQSLPNLNRLFYENYEDALSDFDKKIKKALNFNWKEEKKRWLINQVDYLGQRLFVHPFKRLLTFNFVNKSYFLCSK